MNKEDFYFLGKITKTSGYTGSLVFFFDVDDIERYRNLEAVFIDLHGALIPFVIQKIQFKKGSTAFVELDNISTEEEGIALVGSELFLPLSYLPTLTGNKFYYHEVIDFEVIDSKIGIVGKIEKVFDQSSQALLVVKKGESEILIPIVDEIIKKVDRNKKVIEIEAPEGLIDIYL